MLEKPLTSQPCSVTSPSDIVNPSHPIRQLVEKALYLKQLTPEIEQGINDELTRLGYISDVDYEALELLMAEMDAGRIQLVASS
jgi:hypothetical protein